MLIISQSIFIYLLIKFQKPFTLKNRKTESSSQLKSYRSDSAESSLETIIRRNVVKTAKENDMNDSFRWADNEEALDAALYVQYLKSSFVQVLPREADRPLSERLNLSAKTTQSGPESPFLAVDNSIGNSIKLVEHKRS